MHLVNNVLHLTHVNFKHQGSIYDQHDFVDFRRGRPHLGGYYDHQW
jgi:hypothetical protein